MLGVGGWGGAQSGAGDATGFDSCGVEGRGGLWEYGSVRNVALSPPGLKVAVAPSQDACRSSSLWRSSSLLSLVCMNTLIILAVIIKLLLN